MTIAQKMSSSRLSESEILILFIGLLLSFHAVCIGICIRNLTKRINDLSYVQETYDDYARVQAEEQVYEKLDLATITKNEQLYPLIAQLENELPTTIHVKNIQTDGSLVTLNMEADRKVTVGQMLLNFYWLAQLPYRSELQISLIRKLQLKLSTVLMAILNGTVIILYRKL